MKEELIYLGKRIAELRIKRGMTQEQLAELLNYSPNHISKLESARTNPSFDLLVRLSEIFEIKLKELFNFSEHKDIDEIKKDFKKIINSSDNNNLRLLYKFYQTIND